MDCSFLAQAWREAKKRNHVRFDENPWIQLRPSSVKSEKRRALTAHEISWLLKTLPSLEPWERFTFFLGLYTGARLTSIVLLPRACVDLTARLVSFPDEIVKEKPYVVPLHPEVISFLAGYTGGDKTHFVPREVRDRHQQKSYVIGRMRFRFSEWRRVTALETPPGLFHRASFHCLRHTFITALRMAGVERGNVQLLAGHASGAITDAYTHVDAQLLEPAIQRLTYLP